MTNKPTVTLPRDVVELVLNALTESVDTVRNEYNEKAELYKNYPSRKARVDGYREAAEAHEKAIEALRSTTATSKGK